MKLSSLVLVGALILTVLALNGCKKYRLNKQTTSAEDNALAEDSFDDIFKNINEAADEQNLDGTAKLGWTPDYTFSSSCATITLNPPAWDTTMSPPAWNNTFPKTLTIDFGSANCVGNDNKARRGKIISVFSGKHNESGTVATTTLDNYHVNDYHVEGTKAVTNNGSNSFSIEVDGNVTSPDGNDEVSWTSTRTRTWIEGQNTNFWTLNPDSTCCEFFDGILDDVYSITGTASGVNRNGRNFEAEITVPLRIEFCGWIPEITEGTVEIQPEDLKLRMVDFGDRECDRTFVVTIGNKSYTKTY
jgi:hypothetical protein